MSTDVLTTSVADRIAVITLGSAKRIYFDAEMGDALTAALEDFAGNPEIHAGVITGATPLAQGLALERIFLKLCVSDAGLSRMRSYEAANITSPASSIEVDATDENHG